MCVYTGNSFDRDFCLSVWEPYFEDVITKLDFVQKVAGRLMRAWKGDSREGCLKEKGVVLFLLLLVTSKDKTRTNGRSYVAPILSFQIRKSF